LPDEIRALGALLISLSAVWALTPVAIRVARKTGFYDHPVGYKAHAVPTAYLGGTALVGAFAIGTFAFVGDLSRFWPIVACAVALCALGTLDDRRPVAPRYRILAELVAAAVLTATGLGWSFLASDFETLLLTSIWILGFTNAFNLMDNMDGAAGTTGCVCAAGIAAFALINGDAALAALACAAAGACLGFLRYNLRKGAPARIFLGDGGSMPLGFIIAAAAIQIPVDGDMGWPVLLGAGLLLGLLVLDTLLVVVSRTRRRVALVTAGRDHLTHRLHMRLGSPRDVAVALAVAQAGVSALAIAALEYGRTAVIVASFTCLALGAMVIALLEKPSWSASQRHSREVIGAVRD
jgi:UDP-GlcNAc:undecaprenyl-phosphate/decaprenyl-phosphate GlcNAc-1-phosphate transferase